MKRSGALDGVIANEQQTAVKGHRAFDEEQVALGIDLNDLRFCTVTALHAVMAGHALAFEHAGGVGVGAHGADAAVILGTVGHGAGVVQRQIALVKYAAGDAANVDFIVYINCASTVISGADFQFGSVVQLSARAGGGWRYRPS